MFLHLYEVEILEFQEEFDESSPENDASLWKLLKSFFGNLLERVKKLQLIFLPKISEELAKKQNFSIVIPGTYSVVKTVPKLVQIDPKLHVIRTQQHPRSVFMLDSKGRNIKFLLKGNEDLRVDQRIMQFFDLIDSIFRKENLCIVKYSIVPLTRYSGLISWVSGSDTLHQLICDQRTSSGRSQSLEPELLDPHCGNIFNSLNSLQKIESFNAISSKCSAFEIRDLFYLRSPNTASWNFQTHNFSTSTALMSMVGYLIGLGDRHPGNIMIQQDTGVVVHIDFSDSFEVTVFRQKFPEFVPFRLTRMIQNALNNKFQSTCEKIMSILRQRKFHFFVHEPVEVFTNGNHPTIIMERLHQKLNGTDDLFFDLPEGPEMELDVETQVSQLISVASSPEKYVNHYQGWICFW